MTVSLRSIHTNVNLLPLPKTYQLHLPLQSCGAGTQWKTDHTRKWKKYGEKREKFTPFFSVLFAPFSIGENFPLFPIFSIFGIQPVFHCVPALQISPRKHDLGTPRALSKEMPEIPKIHCFSETGRIRFRRVRFQTPNSVSFFVLTEFWGGELNEFLSAYYLCAKANSPSFPQNSPSLPKTQ